MGSCTAKLLPTSPDVRNSIAIKVAVWRTRQESQVHEGSDVAEKEGRTALPMCLLPAAVKLEFREQWGAAHTDGSSSRPRTRGRAPERPESACTGEKCRATADSMNSAAPRGVEEPRGLSVRMLASPPAPTTAEQGRRTVQKPSDGSGQQSYLAQPPVARGARII